MKNDIFDIIKNKKYSELNTSELSELSGFVNDEAEFEDFKKSLYFLSKQNTEIIIPEQGIENMLLNKFKKSKKFEGESFTINRSFMKLAAIAVAGLLISFLVWNSVHKSNISGQRAYFENHEINIKHDVNEKLIPENYKNSSTEKVYIAQKMPDKQIIADTNIIVNIAQTSLAQQKNVSNKSRSFKNDEPLADIMFVAL